MPAIRMISATHCGSVMPAKWNPEMGPVVSKVSRSARANASLGAMPSRRSVPSMSKSARRMLGSGPGVWVLVGRRLDFEAFQAAPHHNRSIDHVIAALSGHRGEGEAGNHDPVHRRGIDVLDGVGRHLGLLRGPGL